MTETLTFNRNDWSGRTDTVTVHADGSFTLMSYTFRLVELSEPGYDAEMIRLCGRGYKIVGDDWREPLGTVWTRNGNTEAIGGDLSRDHASPIIAAAQLLCNLI